MGIVSKIFQRKPKSYLLHDRYEIVPAFKWKGEVFYMHKDPLGIPAGRGLTSLVYMEELLMRCDIEYLKEHIAAMRAIFKDQRKVDLSAVITLNNNLEERINMLAALPEHVYKLASVVFFTKHESPFHYDMSIGKKRVQQWQEVPDMYRFFLQTPLKDLIPSLVLPEQNSERFLEVQESIKNHHLTTLRKVKFNAS